MDEIVRTSQRYEKAGHFIPKAAAVSYLTDSLTGILKGGGDMQQEKAERLKKKYEAVD